MVTRPSTLVGKDRLHNIFRSSTPAGRLAVVHDNVVHVRKFVKMLFDERLFRESNGEVDFASLHTTLRRMWALLAMMFGCIREGGALLTVMDHLLEELARQVVGYVDPKMETVRMRRLKDIMAKASDQVEVPKFPSQTGQLVEELAKEHRARFIFSELARFYRGAVLLSFVAVSLTKDWGANNQDELWYAELVKLSSHCGHRRCHEQLRVRKILKAKQNVYGLGVAVRDARLGFPDER